VVSRMNPAICFTPLSGSGGKSRGFIGLLKMDNTTLLLDCGSSLTHLSLDNADQRIHEILANELESVISQLEVHSPSISAVSTINIIVSVDYIDLFVFN